MAKSIAITRDFPEHKFLQSLGFTNLYLTVKPIQNFRMLMGDRVELVTLGEIGALSTIEEAGIDPSLIEKTDVKLFETELYIAFSKDILDSDIQKWQAALDQVKASGKQTEIIRKYIIE